MPTISIIIPNYNHAAYLKQRIDSVLHQTFQEVEVIILDDGSTDNSREIIELYRNHPKVSQIVYNDKNSGGVFKQWIKGIGLAKGEYIWIAESDDHADEHFLEETLHFLEKDNTLGMVFTNSQVIDTDGKFLYTTEEDKKASYTTLKTCKNTIDKTTVPDFLISEMIISNASAVLFRKNMLLSVNFQELRKLVNTGDRFVYIGIALQSNIQYLPKVLNFMRSHESNTTKKSEENGNIHIDRLRVLNYYVDEVVKNVPYAKRAIVDFYKSHYFYFVNHCRANEHLTLLKKLKNNHFISPFFYFSAKKYATEFSQKVNLVNSLRRIQYRILLLQGCR